MITRRRILLALVFGGPALALIGLLVYVLIAGHTEVLLEEDGLEASSTVSWTGPTRAPAECPRFMAEGAELFGLDRITDKTTLDGKVHDRTVEQVGTERVAVRTVSFISYEMDGCEVRPIRIRAVVALPVGAENTRSGRLAGIVRAHGLLPGGEAKDAAELAAQLDAAVLAYYGPGFLGSEGWDSRPAHMFDTAHDARRSWLWSHTVALMRGITFLEAMPEVSEVQLGVFGMSFGGAAALIAAGVDPRIKATAVVSASGYLDLAARAEPVPGWEVALLGQMRPPRGLDSPEWQGFLHSLDPSVFLSSVRQPVLLVDGAQDQYFPLNSLARTFTDLTARSKTHRLDVISGFDHGPIAETVMRSVRPAYMSNVRYWFRLHLHLGDGQEEEAPVPEVAVQEVECCPEGKCRRCAEVTVELARLNRYTVDEVEVHVSSDRARTFIGYPATGNRRTFQRVVETHSLAELEDAVYFVEVVYRPLGEVRRVRLTSVPHLPTDFSPRIWPDGRGG
ncbi:MAG: prolyl oligopeptidase family serine peptidase [Myxococcales bacterium]|nr:prolyl oligopeptidase family serine peptidase [Myxococcales bacterium]MCB9648085.1 prolyl oligopeptidase family serine peptidase [Deltaproteobacteria bacterium]